MRAARSMLRLQLRYKRAVRILPLREACRHGLGEPGAAGTGPGACRRIERVARAGRMAAAGPSPGLVSERRRQLRPEAPPGPESSSLRYDPADPTPSVGGQLLSPEAGPHQAASPDAPRRGRHDTPGVKSQQGEQNVQLTTTDRRDTPSLILYLKRGK